MRLGEKLQVVSGKNWSFGMLIVFGEDVVG